MTIFCWRECVARPFLMVTVRVALLLSSCGVQSWLEMSEIETRSISSLKSSAESLVPVSLQRILSAYHGAAPSCVTENVAI